MFCIAQHQLESVLAGRKLDTRLGLARAKMKMRLVLCNRFVGVERFGHIKQQMMMAAVLKIVARVGDTHVAQAEATPESALDRSAVLRPHEIQNGIFWRRLSLSPCGKWQASQDDGQRDQPDDLHDTSSSNALRGTVRCGNRGSDIERWCRNYRGSPAAHSGRHSSRSRTE